MEATFKKAGRQLERWKATMRETLSDRRVRRFLLEYPGAQEKDFDNLAAVAEDTFLPKLDAHMREYAVAWKAVSDRHMELGLYRRIAEFAGLEQGHELLVDVGCGCANFLAVLGRGGVIGMDINPYALEIGAETLASRGVGVSLHPDSFISFDPGRSFVLKPAPIIEELDLCRANLIADDLETFANTMRVLYMHGVKADVVTFMLFGGTGPRKAVEFFDMIREFKGMKVRVPPEDEMTHYNDALVRGLRMICKKGGRLVLGMRGGTSDGDGAFFEDLAKRHSDFLDVRKTHSMELHDEAEGNLVQLRSIPAGGGREFSEEEKALLQGIQCRLQLLEAIVK